MKSWRFWILIGLLSPLLWGIPTLFERHAPSKMRAGWQIIRPPHEVSSMALQGYMLWVGGKDGVAGIDTQRRKIVKTLVCDSPVNFVKALLIDQRNWLWIAHDNGLSYYDGIHCRDYQPDNPRFRVPINTLYLDRQRRLWIGTWQGAAVKEATGWRWLGVADGLPDPMINLIAQDSRGGMWFGSAVALRGGLNYCLRKSCQRLSIRNGLPHNSITSFWMQSDDQVWVGTGLFDRGGAVQLRATPSGWVIQKKLTDENGLAGAKVRSIYQDKYGILWFGSENDGLARLAEGRWLIFTTADGLASQEVKAMLEDKGGDLWIATRDGLTVVPAKQLLTLKEE